MRMVSGGACCLEDEQLIGIGSFIISLSGLVHGHGHRRLLSALPQDLTFSGSYFFQIYVIPARLDSFLSPSPINTHPFPFRHPLSCPSLLLISAPPPSPSRHSNNSLSGDLSHTDSFLRHLFRLRQVRSSSSPQ